MNVKGKIAVVTGASSGLGAALAIVLVIKGARVYGLSRNAKRLNKIETELGKNFIPVEMNIADRQKIEQWIKKTFSESHLPDILINIRNISFSARSENPKSRWASSRTIRWVCNKPSSWSWILE